MFQSREQHVAEWVDSKHGEGLLANRELLEYVAGLLDPWSGRALEHPHDGLMGALIARSVKTFAAFPHLVRNGYGEQAAMLNRSLFEDMVDAHWVSVHPDLAVERYEQQTRHNSMVMAERVAKHRDIYPDVVLPEHDKEDRRQLNGIFGRYGDKHWTGLNLHQRTEAIEECWTDEEGRGHLRFFRDIAHRLNTQLLHASAYSLNETIRAERSPTPSYKLGPSTDNIDQAIFCAYWTFLQTASLMVEHFQLDDPAVLAALRDRHMPSFNRLTEEELRGVGRNAPCPCGSGTKFKRCHGR
jgi:hypothetical protein